MDLDAEWRGERNVFTQPQVSQCMHSRTCSIECCEEKGRFRMNERNLNKKQLTLCP